MAGNLLSVQASGGPSLTDEEIDALIAESGDDDLIEAMLVILDTDSVDFLVPEAASEADSGPSEEVSLGHNRLLDLSFGMGYHSNVTQSAFDRLGSMFSSAAASAVLASDPGADWRGRVISVYERSHFLDLPEINDEVFGFASLQGERLFDSDLLGIQIEYVYFDQFFDASTSDLVTASQRLQLHEYTSSFYWNRTLAGGLLFELDLGIERTEVVDSNDDLTTPFLSSALTLPLGPGERSSLRLHTELSSQSYDHRPARQSDGLPLGERARLLEVKTGLELKGSFENLPRADFKLETEAQAQFDQQGGYYENMLVRIGGEASYDFDWLRATAYARALGRDYPERSAPGDPQTVSTRLRSFSAGTALTLPIHDRAELELAYDFERSDSDSPASDFSSHRTSLTLNLSF